MTTSSTPRFRPRARLMLLLGDQLIRDAGIAVFELVKNAYDADATYCKIKLSKVQTGDLDATIVVEDNGHGMAPQRVRSVWLSPG
ncbi:MAG: ATP-binding protein, partial [Rubripirellula sp.]